MPQMGVSVSEGTITKWLKQQGATVDVGTKLAVIGGDGASAQPAEPAEPVQQDAPPEPATAEAAAETEAASSGESPAPTAPSEPAPAQAEAPSTNGKTFVSPVVAKIASEHGVDPSQVTGTGRGGRVTKKDILGFIESGAQAPAEAPAAAPSQPTAPAP